MKIFQPPVLFSTTVTATPNASIRHSRTTISASATTAMRVTVIRATHPGNRVKLPTFVISTHPAYTATSTELTYASAILATKVTATSAKYPVGCQLSVALAHSPRALVIAFCSSNEDCSVDEECLYVSVSQQYECVCKEGLTRDSQHHCVRLSGSCGGGTCVENAECLYDDQYQAQYCSCKSGYVGDGITECVLKPVGCNVLNNCGLHASCRYEVEKELHICKCDEGFYGDGFVCYKEKTCSNDPGLCHPKATCVADASR